LPTTSATRCATPCLATSSIASLGADRTFRFPFCHQGGTLDPEFGKGKRCSDYAPPVLKLGAQVAALDMHFFEGKQFPARYRGGTSSPNAAHGIDRKNPAIG
jgi:hypothetical protein